MLTFVSQQQVHVAKGIHAHVFYLKSVVFNVLEATIVCQQVLNSSELVHATRVHAHVFHPSGDWRDYRRRCASLGSW